MLSVPSYVGREFPRCWGCFVAEIGEVKVVSATGVRVHGELVLEDEGAVLDDVVDGDEALECHGGVVGGLEAVHEEFDGGGGGGA